MCRFRTFRLIAQFSAFDFWNRGDILDRYRWKSFSNNIFSKPKKIATKKKMVSTKNIFFLEIEISEMSEIEMSKISKFRGKIEILKFSIFDFRNFRNFDFRNFEKSKKSRNLIFFFKDFFRHDFFLSWKYFLPISTRKFPKIPKIVLRKSCDEPKHAKTPRDR